MESGFKVNEENSFSGFTETEYLRLSFSKNRVRPLSYKLYSINEMEDPTKVHDMCRIVRLVNYYRDIWHKRAHKLANLTQYFH